MANPESEAVPHPSTPPPSLGIATGVANFSIIGNARKAWTCFSRCSPLLADAFGHALHLLLGDLQASQIEQIIPAPANEVFWTPA